MIDPVYRLIGLAQKANCLLSGSGQLEGSIKKGKGKYLLIASDSSGKTKEQYERAAHRAGIDVRVYGTKEELGQSMGKGIRTAVLITDTGFGKAIFKKIDSRAETKE